jgi:hypothetical protein
MKLIANVKRYIHTYLRKNRGSIIIALLIVIGFTINEVIQRTELQNNSVTTTARITSCKRIYYAGRWLVEIEYKSLSGSKISRSATLYKRQMEECLEGKEVRVRYSLSSNLFEILD